jgi:hypothetical protein
MKVRSLVTMLELLLLGVALVVTLLAGVAVLLLPLALS